MEKSEGIFKPSELSHHRSNGSSVISDKIHPVGAARTKIADQGPHVYHVDQHDVWKVFRFSVCLLFVLSVSLNGR